MRFSCALSYNHSTTDISVEVFFFFLPLQFSSPMEQDILWKPDSHLACQTIPRFLYGTRKFITMFVKVRHWTLS
jgi:hypothetical protein